jgi:hypothetical protein
MDAPLFLVQDDNNNLQGYDREDILRCDLAINKDRPPKRIFRLSKALSLGTSYDAVDISEFVPTESLTLSIQLAAHAPAALQLDA